MASEKMEKYILENEDLKKRLSSKNSELKKIKMKNLFLETLFNGISEEIMVIDQEFKINDVNKTFLTRYGLKKNDVLGKKCYELGKRSWVPCYPTGSPCPVLKAEKTGEMVEITHSYDGEGNVPKEFTLIIYPLTPEGEKTKYFLEIVREVTEYRDLILKMHRSEKRFKAILDTATDAIISINEEFKIELFNKSAQRIFGYTSSEAIGKDIGILFPNERDNNDEYEQLCRFLKQRDPDISGKTISLDTHRKNGGIFPVEIGISCLEMGGRITFTAIIRDMTEQQQEKGRILQSERLAAVGQAVAHVAHEIRNPLMIIGGFTNQIKASLQNEKDLNKIDMVIDEVTRLEKLVDNLGDFTKEYKLVKRLADVNSVIRDVVKIMTGINPSEKYILRKNLSKDIREINCDPDKLKQVFINIVSNGLEAMPYGGKILITTEKLSEGIEIRIEDEGIGILEEDLKKIFEPFFTTRERGSGLGLAISYKIIEAHSGDLWAISRPGKGTTFIIQLPEG